MSLLCCSMNLTLSPTQFVLFKDNATKVPERFFHSYV